MSASPLFMAWRILPMFKKRLGEIRRQFNEYFAVYPCGRFTNTSTVSDARSDDNGNSISCVVYGALLCFSPGLYFWQIADCYKENICLSCDLNRIRNHIPSFFRGLTR